MRTSPTKGKRNPNSMFGIFCTEFNKMPVGTRYTSKQIREKIPSTLKRNEMASYGMPYTVSVFNIMMIATGLAKRVKRGVFEVLGHVPDFVTYSTCWANRGHDTRIINGKTIKYQKWKLGDPPLVNEKKVKSNTDGIEGEIRIGETYIIVTKDKLTAREILKFILEKGSKIEVEAWIIKGTNNIAANIPWSPGFKRSFGADMTNFKGFVSFTLATSDDIQPDLNVVKSKLIILGQIEGCFRTKGISDAVIAMAEGIGPVHVFEISEKNPEMVHISAEGVVDWVEVTKLKDIRVVDATEYRKILYPERDVFVMRDLKTDSYKTDSHLSFFKGTDSPLTKEQQIVSILKEGLSAVDAAKKIMKLF